MVLLFAATLRAPRNCLPTNVSRPGIKSIRCQSGAGEPAPAKPKIVRKKKASGPADEKDSGAGAAKEQLLSLATSTAVAWDPSWDDTLLVKSFSKEELQAIAVARGVPKSGSKPQLAARIIEAASGQTSASAANEAPVAAPKKSSRKRAPKAKAPQGSDVSRDLHSGDIGNRSAAKSKKKETAYASAVEPTAAKILSNSRRNVFEKHEEALEAAELVAKTLNTKRIVLLGQQEALHAAATVAKAVNTKRKILEKQQEAIEAAAIAVAATNTKYCVISGREEAVAAAVTMVQEVNNNRQQGKTLPRPGAATTNANENGISSRKRRKLTPEEAAKVLEEVVQRQGTGGVGLSGDANSRRGKGHGDAGGIGAPGEVVSEVKSLKEVMASLKERSLAQERNTEQLQAVIERVASSSTQTQPSNTVVITEPKLCTSPQTVSTTPSKGSNNSVEASKSSTKNSTLGYFATVAQKMLTGLQIILGGDGQS